MSESTPSSIDVNFFKPTSGIARDNNKLITLFIIIWAVAVFGFQFLLMGTNKMTPEPTLIRFNEIWPQVVSGQASATERQEFGRLLLMVLGKNTALVTEDVAVLREALALTVSGLGAADVTDVAAATRVLGLGGGEYYTLMIEMLPVSLIPPEAEGYSGTLPAVMAKYCTHPRGPLTDFIFLGFPFHYWYTAQLLLIIFVLICFLYTRKIERLYRKHNYSEEEHD